jgi:hypothetical protein
MQDKQRRRARSDLEQLVREMLPIAKAALEERGAFAPFGGAMLVDGEIRTIDTDEPEEPTSTESVVASLHDRLKGGAHTGDYRATVAIVNVRVRQPGNFPRDAVQVKLDHAVGASLELFFPYRLKRPGVATFGRAFSRDGDSGIFE